MEIGGAEGDGGGILHSHMEFGGDRQDWISRRGIGEGISKGVKGVPSAHFLVQPPGDRAARDSNLRRVRSWTLKGLKGAEGHTE